MDVKDRFKQFLKEAGLSGKDFSGLMFMDYSYYRKVTRIRKGKVLNWMRSFIIGYELGKMSGDADKTPTSGGNS